MSDRNRRVSVYFLDGLGQKKTTRRSRVIFATVSGDFETGLRKVVGLAKVSLAIVVLLCENLHELFEYIDNFIRHVSGRII